MNIAEMQKNIKHVVVLMLENRSFDNLLGWLYDEDEQGGLRHVPPLQPNEKAYHGLTGQDLDALANTVGDLTVKPGRGVPVLFSPQYDPHEPYLHVNVQLFEKEENPSAGEKPTMKGFLKDYASLWSPRHWDSKREEIAEIMDCLTPAEAPVINTLAKFYGISDEWYSSVPTQTNANRAFANCGSSDGRTDNQGPFGVGKPFDLPTIWNAMEAAGNKSWRVYYSDRYPPIVGSKSYTQYLFPDVGDDAHEDHFRIFGQFNQDCLNGDLPAYTFIEPSWTYKEGTVGQQGNDYHPPGGITAGETFLKNIYLSLTANDALWRNTLFVVTFDEHGGIYDHVPPPWGAKPPWEGGTAPTLEHGFEFDRFGVRVPTLFISPWVDLQTLVRAEGNTPFDHTSLIATILNWQNVPRSDWAESSAKNYLGARAANAPTFESVLNASEPRMENAFAETPASGNMVGYGDKFYLEHVPTSTWIGPYKSYLDEWYPILSDEKDRVLVYFQRHGHSGAVRSGDAVKLKTTEDLTSDGSSYDTLGAWETSHWTYWYIDEDESGKEQWQIARADGKLGPLRYGDEVYILNLFTSFTHNWDGYGLQNDPNNPTWLTAAPGRQTWRIVKS